MAKEPTEVIMGKEKQGNVLLSCMQLRAEEYKVAAN